MLTEEWGPLVLKVPIVTLRLDICLLDNFILDDTGITTADLSKIS